jgi:hypothetical protein
MASRMRTIKIEYVPVIARLSLGNMISGANVMNLPHKNTLNFQSSFILKLYNYLARQEIQKLEGSSRGLRNDQRDDRRKTTS